MAARARRPDSRPAMKMVFPGPAAADAWAVRAADRSAVHLAKRRAAVRDCPWAWDRDFLWVMAEGERPVVPERRDARWRQAPRPLDGPPMAAHLPGQPVGLLAPRVESVSQPVQALRASPRPARSQAQEPEPEPWAQLLVQRAPQLARSSPVRQGKRASPPARRVEQERPVSQPQAQHSLVGVPQLPQASFAQPSRLYLSPLFLP
jgi:hypothetical protein